MTLSRQDKEQLSAIRFAKAQEFLQDAYANVRESRYKTGVNRAYYAALSAVRSLLVLEGADSETHSGALTVLSLRFVKTGLLPVDVVKNVKLLLSRRTDVDYGDFETVSSEDAEDSLQKADLLLRQIDAVRKQLIADGGET